MGKKLAIFIGAFIILLSLAGCSFAESKDRFSKEDATDTSHENEITTQSMASEKDAITTETKDVEAEYEETESEIINTSRPDENINNKPATNPTTSTPTTSTPPTSTPTTSTPHTSTPDTNNSVNTESESEEEESPDHVWEDIPLEPQISREAFDLINAERIKLGLEPAVWDAECERIALIRGEEIAPYAIPEHDGFLKFQNENRKLCECLAWGYLTAEGVVDGWMNSSAHKNILMDPIYVNLAVVRVGNKWVAVNSR